MPLSFLTSTYLYLFTSVVTITAASHAFITTIKTNVRHRNIIELDKSIEGQHQQWQQCMHGSRTLYSSSSSENTIQQNSQEEGEGIRLNKVFKETHSRRQADALISEGRVSVNGEPVTNRGGFRVRPFLDTVELDGVVIIGWEEMNGFASPKKEKKQQQQSSQKRDGKISTKNHFEYVKYWKPRGVICTTDLSIKHNIIDEVKIDGYKPKHRVYPVGRLDKDTSGLILLTSDGRLPNSALRGKFKQPKMYEVFVNKPIRRHHVEQLQNGIVITTVAQRDGKKAPPLTAKTLPCKVQQIDDFGVRMTLTEGRNRQIRKMMEALNLRVVELHRINFMGLDLNPLQGPGDWTYLDEKEMRVVQDVLQNAENEIS